MNKIKVACIFGGCSSEYSVSLVSATSVLRNMNEEKYDIIKIGITSNGDSYLYNGPTEFIEEDKWFKGEYLTKISFSSNKSDHGLINMETNEIIKIDIAFPVLHGKNGEDGTIQGLLELAGIPCVGCDLLSSALCMEKSLAHDLVGMHGILVPKYHSFYGKTSFAKIKEEIKDLGYPVFVKPIKAGSSYGITRVTEESELEAAVDLAFSHDDSITIESEIDGFEVGCAIMGNTDLIAGVPDEIELSSGFFNFEEKYTLKTSAIHLPARIPASEQERVVETAKAIYRILHCKGMARVDMFYTKDKKIVFNEVNTIPGFTSHSRFPSMLKEVGIDFPEVIDKVISLGLE